ncbi:MAG: UbiA family prenyltransferase [Acidobacteria bacterium]|nr:UbiA family prenyltransferase [Acidobacteriota bacterium]
MRAAAIALQPSRFATVDFIALARPRLNVLVVLTASVGYWLGAARGGNALVLLGVVFGTALVAAGASALNQLLERDIDALMQRTRLRPL